MQRNLQAKVSQTEGRTPTEENSLSLTGKTYVYGNYIDDIVAMQTSLPSPTGILNVIWELSGATNATAQDVQDWINATTACATPCPTVPDWGVNDTVLALINNAANAQSVGTFYYHQDDLHSTCLITNILGLPTDRYTYDAYGGIHHLLGASQEARLFTGRNYDAESGLYYYRTRYYSPDQGRFINVDTIGIWGDENNLGNGYTYVGNMVLQRMDPTGKCWDFWSSDCRSKFGEGWDRLTSGQVSKDEFVAAAKETGHEFKEHGKCIAKETSKDSTGIVTAMAIGGAVGGGVPGAAAAGVGALGMSVGSNAIACWGDNVKSPTECMVIGLATAVVGLHKAAYEAAQVTSTVAKEIEGAAKFKLSQAGVMGCAVDLAKTTTGKT